MTGKSTELRYFSGQKGYNNDKVVFIENGTFHRGVTISSSEGKFIILRVSDSWERPENYNDNLVHIDPEYIYRISR